MLVGIFRKGANNEVGAECEEVTAAMSMLPDFRIENGVEDIDRQVDDHHEGGEENDHGLYDR